MLQGYPTKNGTGITIYGTPGDIEYLYHAVHDIAKHLDEDNQFQAAQCSLLMNFAYDLRKAYMGHRLKEEFTFTSSDEKYIFYGDHFVWTDILIFISTLRHNAGFTITDRLTQSMLYMLEHVVEKGLSDYDPQGANNIKEFIGHRIDITNKYAFIIYQALHIEFVTSPKGKKRFRNIPNLLINYFSSYTQEYKDLIKSFEVSAKEQNCEITDLEFSDFPEITW